MELEQPSNQVPIKEPIDSDFDDEKIEELLEFKDQPETEPNQYLNIQHYFDNQTAFNQLLVNIHNQLDPNHQLVDPIREYLTLTSSQLLENKRAQINELNQQITQKETNNIIAQGNLIGVRSFLNKLQEIMKSRSNQFNNNYEDIKKQNQQIKQNIVLKKQNLERLETQIFNIYLKQSNQLENQNHKTFAAQSQKHNKLIGEISDLQTQIQNERKVQKKLLKRIKQYKQQQVQENQIQDTKPISRDKIVDQCIFNLKTRVQVKNEPEQPTKRAVKHQVSDRTIPNRVYWVVIGMLIVVHILWRFIF